MPGKWSDAYFLLVQKEFQQVADACLEDRQGKVGGWVVSKLDSDTHPQSNAE